MANILLWRHAEAEVESATGSDFDRALTKRGRKDALKIAAWLVKNMPEDIFVFTSPALRCIETATALQIVGLSVKIAIQTADFLAVDTPVQYYIAQGLKQAASKNVLLIGHQPNLAYLIGDLIRLPPSACVVKKGAVWWIRERNVDDGSQRYLFSIQQPDYAIKN